MFPSVFNTFNRPTTTDRLNSPSHSALHNTVSSALGQVEAVIGLSTSSAVGTLMYDVRSPDSNGGGHVQTANKGGTGQTNYTKGDVLVASSQSVLTKLAIGVDGQALLANSSTATGIAWGNASGNKIKTSGSVITITGVGETSIIFTTVNGSVLSGNAVRSQGWVQFMALQNGASVLVRALYGGANVASVMISPTVNTNQSIIGTINFSLFGNSATAQRGVLQVDMRISKNNPNAGGSSLFTYLYDTNTSSVNSSANQSFGITVRKSNENDVFILDASTVEKIV